MKRGTTGRYVVTSTTGERVEGILSPPRCRPHPALVLHGPMQQALERALLALGRLDGVTTLLPDPALFIYAYVRKEAVLSSQIEGTQSSLSDLLLFELDEAPGAPLDERGGGVQLRGRTRPWSPEAGSGIPTIEPADPRNPQRVACQRGAAVVRTRVSSDVRRTGSVAPVRAMRCSCRPRPPKC